VEAKGINLNGGSDIIINVTIKQAS